MYVSRGTKYLEIGWLLDMVKIKGETLAGMLSLRLILWLAKESDMGKYEIEQKNQFESNGIEGDDLRRNR